MSDTPEEAALKKEQELQKTINEAMWGGPKSNYARPEKAISSGDIMSYVQSNPKSPVNEVWELLNTGELKTQRPNVFTQEGRNTEDRDAQLDDVAMDLIKGKVSPQAVWNDINRIRSESLIGKAKKEAEGMKGTIKIDPDRKAGIAADLKSAQEGIKTDFIWMPNTVDYKESDDAVAEKVKVGLYYDRDNKRVIPIFQRFDDENGTMYGKFKPKSGTPSR